MPNIGKLEPVDLRTLWAHEERGFSAWLESNLDVLSTAVGLQLSDPERERSAGRFQVDLVAEDNSGNSVVIENQLEATDHDHLGKLLTYMTNLEAKTAIWITSSPRQEHIRTIQWLNEMSPDDISFYLLRLAAYRIADSDPAPLFSLVAGPSAEIKSFGSQKKELAERHVLRLRFWQQLLDRAKQRGVTTHAQRAPTKDGWISAGAGRSGISYNYLIWMKDDSAVELYIDTGDKDLNKRIFDRLVAAKEEINETFGKELSWERMDDKRASRLRYTFIGGGLLDEGKWPEIQEQLITAMDKLVRATRPHLAGAGSPQAPLVAVSADSE